MILLLLTGTAAVLLAWSGAAKLARVQASVPFPLVQPARLPPGLALQSGFASPPPPQVRNGLWLVQLFYGPRYARAGPAAVVVREDWRSAGIVAVIPQDGAQAQQLAANLSGELEVFRAADGARYAQVTFAEGGRAFMVTGLQANLSILLQVARSLAAAARSVRAPGCGACLGARVVDRIPIAPGWVAARPARPWPPHTRFAIVHAQTVPGATGSCAGKTFRYGVMFVSGPGSGPGQPVSGFGGLAAYNPHTCEVAVAAGTY